MVPVSADGGEAPLLQVDGLTVRAGGRALLDDVSFAVARGELVALVGPNGAGKSTLARAIAGLAPPDAGGIRLAGRPLGDYTPRARARQVCYAAQAGDRPPPFTVLEFVRLARYAHDDAPRPAAPPAPPRPAASDAAAIGAYTRAGRDAVEDALALTGMAAFRGRRMATLSGGERQMAALAAALAQEADLLLLDEPAAFLDVRHQEAILSLMARLHRERGATCVMATHDVNAAIHGSRRALGLRDGRLRYDGPAEGLADPDVLAGIYGVAFDFVTHPATGRRTVAGVGAEAARLLRE